MPPIQPATSGYAWKRLGSNEIFTSKVTTTIEELYAASSFGLPVRDLKDYKPVQVKYENGKWIEETEADRIWRLLVQASTT